MFIAVGILKILGTPASLHSVNHPYENNPTQKDLTSQEDLLKRTESSNELTKEPTHLSPLK
ncbi:DUF3519 domain-containing protein [Helicobacter pylori]|uniref:DUF3519 domain-containing protein n=1 Tax=Helicobacter pylori TaxID=210 RepID=UPI003CC5B60F